MLARPFIKVPLNVVVVVPSLSYQTIERVESSLEESVAFWKWQGIVWQPTVRGWIENINPIDNLGRIFASCTGGSWAFRSLPYSSFL